MESGDRLRLHMEVTHAEPDRGGLMIRRNFKMEIEGKRRPGLVADALTLAY